MHNVVEIGEGFSLFANSYYYSVWMVLQYLWEKIPGVRMVHPRVLFVDDEALILENIKEYFRGYEIATESSAIAALRLLEREPYEVPRSRPKDAGLERERAARRS